MSSYLDWAIGLTKHFFGPDASGQRVRLMVTRELLDQEFADLGGTNGFVAAMLKGPYWMLCEGVSLLKRGLRLHAMWELKHARPGCYPKTLVRFDDPPPYLPYLCLLCLAWTEGGESVAHNAYYERLDQLYPDHGLNPHLGEWHKLWDGVEEWTRSLRGSRGTFKVEQLGGWPHVGIPRSQVIFTAAKIERLPGLFACCGLEPEAAISLEQVHGLIVAHGVAAQQALGMVFDEIRKETALGKSALQIIHEHLQDWDGDTATRQDGDDGHRNGGWRGGDAGGHGQDSGGTLMLALRPLDENSRWETALVLERNASTEGIQFTRWGWRTRPFSETGVMVLNQFDAPADAGELAAAWTEGAILHGSQVESDVSLEEATYRLPARSTRVFDRWEGQWLIECRGLPCEGPVYVMVHAEGMPEWATWKAALPQTVEVFELPSSGLPNGHHLFCIREIKDAFTGYLPSMPGGIDRSLRKARNLRFLGGTRCTTSTARRVYADYDPPLLLVYAPEEAVLQVSGATAEGIDQQSQPPNLPGLSVRTYALTVRPSESVVVATLKLGGSTLGVLSFGVRRERVLPGDDAAVVAYDQLGNLTEKNGASGLVVPARDTRWKYTDGATRTGQLVKDSTLDGPAFRLLDSIALHASRLTYAEYKRRAVWVAGADLWRVSEQTRWLAQLGHIDLQVDSRGQWSHVHPAPPVLYPLPWLAQGRYQLVFSGTVQVAQLRKAVEIARTQLRCEVTATPSKLAVVPPRLTVLTGDLKDGELLADAAGLKWTPTPPAAQMASWASGLDAWLGSITWYPDGGPKAWGEYSPEEFRFIAGQAYPAPWRLRRFVDLLTAQMWHLLYQTPNGEHPERHAFARDSSWGMWRVHMIIAEEDDLTNLAYDAKNARLIVPAQLGFPYLLGRALSACSGLPPERLYNCKPYMEREAGVLLPDAKPYAGQCVAYPLVPKELAETITSKVNARLLEVMT